MLLWSRTRLLLLSRAGLLLLSLLTLLRLCLLLLSLLMLLSLGLLLLSLLTLLCLSLLLLSLFMLLCLCLLLLSLLLLSRSVLYRSQRPGDCRVLWVAAIGLGKRGLVGPGRRHMLRLNAGWSRVLVACGYLLLCGGGVLNAVGTAAIGDVVVVGDGVSLHN